MGKEFEYIMSISETLEAGIWIAVVNNDIIKGCNAKEVFKKSREKYPKQEPFIMKVPENSIMLLQESVKELPFHRQKGTFVCSYLSFHDPHLNTTFRLPLVHIKMKNGDVSFRTDALVDSGATGTFVPVELVEILGVEFPEERQDAVGAGSVFSTCRVHLDLIEIYKSNRSFCALENIDVIVPIMEGAIPHTILGRDSLFWVHDITFRERRQHTIFREPKK